MMSTGSYKRSGFPKPFVEALKSKVKAEGEKNGSKYTWEDGRVYRYTLHEDENESYLTRETLQSLNPDLVDGMERRIIDDDDEEGLNKAFDTVLAESVEPLTNKEKMAHKLRERYLLQLYEKCPNKTNISKWFNARWTQHKEAQKQAKAALKTPLTKKRAQKPPKSNKKVCTIVVALLFCSLPCGVSLTLVPLSLNTASKCGLKVRATCSLRSACLPLPCLNLLVWLSLFSLC